MRAAHDRCPSASSAPPSLHAQPPPLARLAPCGHRDAQQARRLGVAVQHILLGAGSARPQAALGLPHHLQVEQARRPERHVALCGSGRERGAGVGWRVERNVFQAGDVLNRGAHVTALGLAPGRQAAALATPANVGAAARVGTIRLRPHPTAAGSAGFAGPAAPPAAAGAPPPPASACPTLSPAAPQSCAHRRCCGTRQAGPGRRGRGAAEAAHSLRQARPHLGQRSWASAPSLFPCPLLPDCTRQDARQPAAQRPRTCRARSAA